MKKRNHDQKYTMRAAPSVARKR